MLYLLQSAEFKENESGEYEFFFSLKIGYTDDETTDLKNNKRLSMYFAHHRTVKLLATIPNGTEEQEKKLHYKFRDLRWDGSNEWYIFDQGIIGYFKSVTLEELDKLPSNPVRGDQRVSKGKRETRKILAYLFDTKEEIGNYLEFLSDLLGDTISFDTSLDYIKSDPNIDKDKFNHFLEVKRSRETNNYTDDKDVNYEVILFLNVYYSKTTIYDKLKLLSEYDMSDEARNIVIGQIPDNDEIKSYYTVLGPDRLYELGYNVTRIKKELGIKTFDLGLLIERVYEVFNVGTRISLSDIKSTLSSIYKEINYDKTPKAVDLQEFFDVKDCILISVVDGKKKRFAGYEILTSHEQELRTKLNLI